MTCWTFTKACMLFQSHKKQCGCAKVSYSTFILTTHRLSGHHSSTLCIADTNVGMPIGMQQSMHSRLLKALSLQQQVTAILYANPDWVPAHGGELRLWLPPGATDQCSSKSASVADSAAPDQHNDGSHAPQEDHAAPQDDHAAPDRLSSETLLPPALNDCLTEQCICIGSCRSRLLQV